MPGKVQTPTIFDNLWLGPRQVEVPTLFDFTSSKITKRLEKAGIFMQEVLLLEDETLTVVDSGGATGGWVAELLANPNTYYMALAGFLDIEVKSVGAGINAAGAVVFGIGSAATTTASITGNNSNFAAAATVSLTGGAGTSIVQGPPIPTFVTPTTPNIYLNIGVADANITADADVTFDLTARLFLLDMQGA